MCRFTAAHRSESTSCSRVIPGLSLLSLAFLPSCGPTGIEVTYYPDIGTFVDVSWETSEPGYSWVEYGTTEARELSSPVSTESSTQHRVTLYGVPALSDVYVRAYTDVGGDILSTDTEFSTTNLPSELPDLTVDIYDNSLAQPTPYIVGIIQGQKNLLFGMDRDGNFLWYQPFHDGMAGFNIQRPLDGNGVIFNYAFWPLSLGTSWVRRQNIKNQDVDEQSFSSAHHDFAQLPDGTLAVIQATFGTGTDTDGSEVTVVGDDILERSPEGVDTTVFSLFDWLEPVPNEYWDLSFYKEGYDWSHANALNYYSDTETYLMSFAHLNSVAEIERSTGNVLRSFGDYGNYGYADAGTTPLRFQHYAHWTEDGTLLMTVHYNADDDNFMAVEYSVDDQARTIEEIWSYGREDSIPVLAEGQVFRLDNGNTLVNFGYAGILREVTPDGEVVWEVLADVGTWFGSIMYVDDFYELE